MEENKSSIGSIIGTIIIIALIILGGLYFWGKRIEESKNLQSLTEEPITEEEIQAERNVISETNSSDELNSIEADLNATEINNLDSELNIELE